MKANAKRLDETMSRFRSSGRTLRKLERRLTRVIYAVISLKISAFNPKGSLGKGKDREQ